LTSITLTRRPIEMQLQTAEVLYRFEIGGYGAAALLPPN
jgi:hypothetical protein